MFSCPIPLVCYGFLYYLEYDRFISSAHLLIVFGKSVFAAQEGGGVGQVEEPEGEEPTE